MSLFLILASIAILDSISILPLTVVPLATLLAGKRPIAGAGSFITGIFITYLLCGFLVLLGFGSLADNLSTWFNNILKSPSDVDLIIQIVLGLVMVLFGWKLCYARARSNKLSNPVTASPIKAFVIGVGITIVGIPAAVPYFGAVSQILRADLPNTASGYLLLAFYCFAFVLPLMVLVSIRIIIPDKSEAIFKSVSSFTTLWGKRIIIAVLALVGSIFIIDGIGWFLGLPFFKF